MRKIKKGTPFPLGVSRTADGVQFALYVPQEKTCSLLLFAAGEEAPKQTIDMAKYRTGNVVSVCFEKKRLEDFEGFEYLYELGGKWVTDPYATKLSGRAKWGADCGKTPPRGVVYETPFEWGADKLPGIKYSDLYVYQLHVRGFTKHASSEVAHKGTFAGIAEKIPYIRDLGFNALLLLPCYDFEEHMKQKEAAPYETAAESRLNYWGYGSEAFYFSPKAAYAAMRQNPQLEMKELVKALHAQGIEAWMDMYFPVGMGAYQIIDCLRFWHLCYHIDGFRVNEEVAPVEILADDPVLGKVKLLSHHWKEDRQTSGAENGEGRYTAEYNDGFLMDVRRFLKSDEGQVRAFMYRLKRNPKQAAVINYITSANGFTLRDLVSYDIKHNEENGEKGRDGTDYNYSWNCGKEGLTKNKQVLALRKKQMKNALLMLYLGQGTPMLLAGDEFGNSQKGNNNPYCQDNAVSWLNWKQIRENEDIYRFVKELIAFRKSHPILHVEHELRGMDYISCGSPDISFHGTKAWYVDDSNYSRLLAVMLNGDYQILPDKSRDDSFYIAFNMHWEPHTFDLPKLTRGRRWILKWDTSLNVAEEKVLENQRSYLVKPRSVVVLRGVKPL